MKKSSRLIWVITLIVNVVVSSAEQLGYRPFPVLLVHGFNATPSTFGAYTLKEVVWRKEAKWEWLFSTRMIENFKETSSEEPGFYTDHLAYEVISAYDDDGNRLNGSVREYHDYFAKSGIESRISGLNEKRFYPHEEEQSYLITRGGQTHYCVYGLSKC